jgi:hypothetical protein
MAHFVDTKGRSERYWIDAAIHEAKTDVLPFGNIVSWGKQWFELDEKELEEFVRTVVRALLDAGAVIVRPREIAEGYEWQSPVEYDKPDPEARIDALLWDQRRINDEHGFFAWFSFGIPSITPRVDLKGFGN